MLTKGTATIFGMWHITVFQLTRLKTLMGIIFINKTLFPNLSPELLLIYKQKVMEENMFFMLDNSPFYYKSILMIPNIDN